MAKDYPIEFVCPRCGSSEKVIENIKNEEVIKGKADENLMVGSATRNIAIFDPRKVSGVLSCPVVMIIQDICAECGTEYISKIARAEGRPQLGPPPGKGSKGFGLPPGFPQGHG